MSETNTATVSISAVSSVTAIGDAPPSLATEAKPKASTLSIASTSTPSDASQTTPTPAIVLLPAADIKDSTSSTSKPPKSTISKPNVAAKKPLTSTITKPSTLTSRAKPTTITKTPPATTSASSTTTRTRPGIPTTLRGASTTSSTTSSRTTPTVRPTTTATTTRLTATATTTASRLKPSPSPTTTSTVRKSPSTPSLSTVTANRALASATRRVASSSGAETSSSRNSPSSTPSATRSPSRASIASTSTTTATATTPTTRRPITSSTAATANRTGATRTTPGVTPTARRTPTGSTIPSPSSTIRSTTLSVRASAAQATTPTRPGATAASVITSRPIPDATKVKMLSTQLNGLQEKHDQTLKLLQEQEERLKRELEELAVIPEQERKPIPSDTQDVLQEMEELRIQFQNANTQHQKTLEDLATERAEELAQIKEAHETLLQAMTSERDSVSLALKSLQESGEATEREIGDKIKELEEQLEVTIEQRAVAVSEHAAAMEALRAEIESAWTLKLESKVQELTEEHEKALQSATDKLVESDSSSQSQIKDLEESYALKLQALKDETDARIAELNSSHETNIREQQEKLTREIESHQNAITLLGKEHCESLETLRAGLNLSQERNVELSSKLGEVEAALEASRKLKDDVDAELTRAQNTAQDQLELVRQELQQIQKLLAIKEEETSELQKKIQELTDSLEHASLGAMLKNNTKYKIKKVEIYGSSVSANLQIKRSQQAISDQLEHLEIDADFVDISTSEEAKLYMRRKNNGETGLPQIFSGGDYRGTYEDFEYAIETHQLPQFLGFDRLRPFVPRTRDLGDKNGLSASGAQDGEDAEQGAGLPDVVINGLSNKMTGTNNHNGTKNTATSTYLLSPASNRFHSNSSIGSSGSTSSMYSKKQSGFVQAASQVWNGALVDEHGRTKHDLGFNAIIADDDELDELFEQGAVTEADLEAMLQSA
ncbi:hypothetical protein BGZ93_000855 [Podila epicladia]|nr:hypothetical protein BGZ92_007777 [Podila epicladia]KAG0098196.1 hypothetical protein BGZ93_000855 [Podila epicladia]